MNPIKGVQSGEEAQMQADGAEMQIIYADYDRKKDIVLMKEAMLLERLTNLYRKKYGSTTGSKTTKTKVAKVFRYN